MNGRTTLIRAASKRAGNISIQKIACRGDRGQLTWVFHFIFRAFALLKNPYMLKIIYLCQDKIALFFLKTIHLTLIMSNFEEAKKAGSQSLPRKSKAWSFWVFRLQNANNAKRYFTNRKRELSAFSRECEGLCNFYDGCFRIYYQLEQGS